MNKVMTLGILTAVVASGFVVTPALANDWRDARRNEFRAERQIMEARRDAAFGNGWGAQRHYAEAARDEQRARWDQHRAWRWGY